jgi:hypothetical protein
MRNQWKFSVVSNTFNIGFNHCYTNKYILTSQIGLKHSRIRKLVEVF